MNKKVEVSYFAMLRDQAQTDTESRITQAKNMNDLFQEIDAEYGFELKQSQLRVAKNHAFVPWETPLEEGDTVVFIPPVSGG